MNTSDDIIVKVWSIEMPHNHLFSTNTSCVSGKRVEGDCYQGIRHTHMVYPNNYTFEEIKVILVLIHQNRLKCDKSGIGKYCIPTFFWKSPTTGTVLLLVPCLYTTLCYPYKENVCIMTPELILRNTNNHYSKI